MAAEYFLYTTLFDNTLVDRSDTSFAPLPPNTGQIFIDYFIPTTQPLYYYKENAGLIEINSDVNIDGYLGSIAPAPKSGDDVFQRDFTGYTALTATKEIILISDTVQDMNTLGGVYLQWDTTVRKDEDYFSHVEGTSQLNILRDGNYKITFSVPMIYGGGGNQTNNVAITVVNNRIPIYDGYVSATINKDSEQTVALVPAEFTLSAGDVIELDGYSLGGTTRADTVPGSVFIIITKVNN